jgi:hypothetical protein
MANKLKNMRLTSVDLVRNGANQEADICLFKSAEPAEDPTQPTTEEKNIFKRFINWLRENHAEADGEPADPETVEKDYTTFDSLNATRESNEKLWQYTSALTESIRSIQMDQDLNKEQKYELMMQSLGQFDEAMEALLEKLSNAAPNRGDAIMAKSDAEDMSYIFEGLEKSAPEEEDVEKFNPNHDSLGRFASGGGGAAAGGLNDKVAGIMAECKEPWEKAAAAGKIGKLADEMQEGDKVTFKHDKRGEMEFVRTKYNDGIMAFNCLSHPNVNASPQHMKGFLEDSVYGGTIPKFTQASSTKKSADIDEIEEV